MVGSTILLAWLVQDAPWIALPLAKFAPTALCLQPAEGVAVCPDEISAARAYDVAALQHRGIKVRIPPEVGAMVLWGTGPHKWKNDHLGHGLQAVTNFPSVMYGYTVTTPATGAASASAAVTAEDEETLIETHAPAPEQPQRSQAQASSLPPDDHADAWAWAEDGQDPLEGLALLPACSMAPVVRMAFSCCLATCPTYVQCLLHVRPLSISPFRLIPGHLSLKAAFCAGRRHLGCTTAGHGL